MGNSNSYFTPDSKFTHNQLESLQEYLIPNNPYPTFTLLLSEYLNDPESRLFVSFRQSKCENGRSCLVLTDPPFQDQSCKIDLNSWWLVIATAHPEYDFHSFRSAMCSRMLILIKLQNLKFRMYPHKPYQGKGVGIGCGFRGLNQEELEKYPSWSKKYAPVMGTLRSHSESIVGAIYSQEFHGEKQRILH